MQVLKILAISLVIWAIPTQLLATEYLQIDVDVAKKLYVDLSFYKLDNQHKAKQISFLETTNEKLMSYNGDLLKLNKEWRYVELNLGKQIITLEDNIFDLEKQRDLWKSKTFVMGENLKDCLKKPWYYVHFPTAGITTVVTLLAIILI